MFEALWSSVLADWDNAKVHDAFVQMALDSGELGRAAVKYREQLAVPGRRELAQKKMNAVVFLAAQALDVGKSEPMSTPRWVLWAAAAACVWGIGLLVWVLAR